VVRGFFEGSPAEKSGMQSGDKIIFANGVCIQEIPHEKQRDFWRNLDKVELIVLRNGEEMKFEFEMNSVLRFNN
jgi:C-terminal processing protease CtpA/Prc